MSFFHSLLSARAIRNPQQIFGSNLKIWINGSNPLSKTTSDDLNSTLESFVTDDSNALSCTLVDSSFKHKYSGSWIYADQNNGYKQTTRSHYTFMHNRSTSWELVVDMRKLTSGGNYFLFHNTNTPIATGGTLNGGLQIRINNTTNRLVVQMTRNNVAYSFNRVIDNAWTINTDHRLRIQYNVTNDIMTIWMNGVQIDSSTRLTPTLFTTNDPSFDTAIGTCSTSSNGLIRQYILVNKLITANEYTELQTYLDSVFMEVGSGPIAYVGAGLGQSNMVGVPDTPPSYLQNELSAYIKSSGTTGFEKIDWPDNQQGFTANAFGPELEFLYNSSVNYSGKVFLHKKAVSGSSQYVEWNVTPGSVGDQFIDDFVSNTLRQLVYRYNRTVIVKFFLWRQGEADATSSHPSFASGSNAVRDYYKAGFQAFYKLFLNDINSSGLPVDTSQCKMVCSLLSYPSNPTYSNWASINEALTNVAENILTLEPSLVGFCVTGSVFETDDLVYLDGVHFDSDGQVAQGSRFYDEIF